MVALVLLAALTVSALAGVRFKSVTTSIGSGSTSLAVLAPTASAPSGATSLLVSWDEVGLGNTAVVNYSATADLTVVYACLNNAGKRPSASNKLALVSPLSAAGTFEADRNGRIVGTLSTGAAPTEPPSGFSCPTGQTLVVASVSYTNVVLTDMSNGVSIAAPPASAVFYAV
jgi:hypothetical protein